MDMPQVRTCEAEECSYNGEGLCHALAITVGDMEDATCDTFCSLGREGGDRAAVGQVGACKMADCMFNDHLECSADGITVSHKGAQIDCMTYRAQ